MDIAKATKKKVVPTIDPMREEDVTDFEVSYSEELQEESAVPIIRFDSVSKAYSNGDPALENINLSILPGEFVSLVGASGAGKSTLLKLIYSEEVPTAGTVLFNGRDLAAIKRKHLPYYRRNIGTVFQDFKLLPQKTAFENIAYALEVYGKPTEEILDEVPQILEIVELENKANNLPKQLSGGEQQRVAIARALILQPKMIIADEPTGNLDPVSAEGIIDLLLEINQLGTTVILATHNQALVNKVGRRVVALDRGRIVSDVMEGQYVFTDRRRPAKTV